MYHKNQDTLRCIIHTVVVSGYYPLDMVMTLRSFIARVDQPVNNLLRTHVWG
jgi:hypothetical protein